MVPTDVQKMLTNKMMALKKTDFLINNGMNVQCTSQHAGEICIIIVLQRSFVMFVALQMYTRARSRIRIELKY